MDERTEPKGVVGRSVLDTRTLASGGEDLKSASNPYSDFEDLRRRAMAAKQAAGMCWYSLFRLLVLFLSSVLVCVLCSRGPSLYSIIRIKRVFQSLKINSLVLLMTVTPAC